MNLAKSERPHISFFGCTNSGKSSLVNAVTNQSLSVVSDIKGTTTDAVQKTMEILPLGPVVIIDTAGINDEGELGELRINATKRILDKTDIAVLVVDSTIGIQKDDKKLVKEFEERKIPYIVVYNKCDLIQSCPPLEGVVEYIKSNLTPPPTPRPQGAGENNSTRKSKIFNLLQVEGIPVSAKTGEGVNELKEALGHILNENKKEKFIIKDKLQQGDIIILVIPIDESAPKGRIILPQQNVLRECLDAHATAVCCQVEELSSILSSFTPKFVITDSQAFNKVKEIVPENIILTSFSILMANYKGSLETLLNGAKTISELQDGDKVLISEGCTHHRQCNDIGTVKMPNWVKEFSKANIDFEFTQGGEFPSDLSKYKLIIHCGGCMLNETEMKSRIKHTKEQGFSIVNYGMAIAYMNGILDRALEIFRT